MMLNLVCLNVKAVTQHPEPNTEKIIDCPCPVDGKIVIFVASKLMHFPGTHLAIRVPSNVTRG